MTSYDPPPPPPATAPQPPSSSGAASEGKTLLSEHINPRANVFLMVNLGCEMLYVIDQRLKAQQIAKEKSKQVMHDVTSVFLEPKFIDSLIVGSTQPEAQLMSEDNCKFMLKDIATCSLMRLDEGSMDKLWNLMTMLNKWQLFHTQHQFQLMDITIRHLEGIGHLYPDENRMQLIDYTKNTLLDFWNSCSDDQQYSIYLTSIKWLEGFNTKISLLIRLGFQALDSSFYGQVDQTYFQEFKESIGENIYVKSSDVALKARQELDHMQGSVAGVSTPANCADQLAEMLNYSQGNNRKGVEDLKPLNFKDFQKQFEKNLQQCNILFEDLDVNLQSSSAGVVSASGRGEEFVYLNPTHHKQNLEPSATSSYAASTSASVSSANFVDKDLLDMYSNLN